MKTTADTPIKLRIQYWTNISPERGFFSHKVESLEEAWKVFKFLDKYNKWQGNGEYGVTTACLEFFKNRRWKLWVAKKTTYDEEDIRFMRLNELASYNFDGSKK